MSSDRSSEQEKPGYDYEVSEPEMDEQEEKQPQPRTKTQSRQRQAPKWATQQPQNQHIAPYQPPQEEDRREKVLKSRIKDRDHSDANDSSLKIKIELDLEAEVNLYARVKGDVTIGLL
jgi:hypothetical protein